MRQRGLRVLAVLVLLGSGGLASAKLSLAVRFPDIEMENVSPGTVINLKEIRGVSYFVTNTSDHAVEVEVISQIPGRGSAQAKLDYEPIPDPQWLRIMPNRFRMGPGDVASAEIILSVPNDPRLVGRHFQVNIHAGTEGPESIAVAVNSYVRFTVGALGPASARKEKRRKVLGALELDLTPVSVRWEGVPLGQTVDLTRVQNLSLKVTNRGNTAVKLKLASVRPDNSQKEEGWQLPDPSWMSLRPSLIKVGANQIKPVRVTLRIPPGPENRGKKFLFLIQSELDGMDFPLGISSRVFVTTED